MQDKIKYLLVGAMSCLHITHSSPQIVSKTKIITPYPYSSCIKTVRLQTNTIVKSTGFQLNQSVVF